MVATMTIGKDSAADPSSASLDAQPKAQRSNAAPAGEGALSDRAMRACTNACVTSRSLEWTRKAAAIAAMISQLILCDQTCCFSTLCPINAVISEEVEVWRSRDGDFSS
jgi:hypothetical protein